MNPRTKNTIPPDSQSAPSPLTLSRESSSAHDVVRVWLLGGFQVSVGLRAISQDAWRLRKAASLMKLLALAPGHRVHRERAMDLLWPELGLRAASNNLRQTLHAARRILDPAKGSGYLVSEKESLVLCPGGQLWVDVEAFEEAAATARRSKDPAAYRAALELYSGELLPADRYEEWAESRRQELRHTWLSLQLKLARMYEERGDYDKGIQVLQRALLEEPTNEQMHAALMRLYAYSERRTEALAQYGRLVEAVSAQLDAEVSATTERLGEEIAAGTFPPDQPTIAPTEESSDTGKHNLPASRTSFVGREHEMLEIKRHLATTGLLTLTGAGGSGKTRLALEVAKDLIGAYPDGVWLAELASLSQGEFVPQAVAEAVGVQGQPGRPIADTLVDALRSKKMLLILDNCEHLVDAVVDLVASLLESCFYLRILDTSREALRMSGEAIWPVSLLSVPDPKRQPTLAQLEGYEAIRLFVDRARQRKPAFALRPENAQAVAQICAYLEGLPLAIELAAARIMMLPPQALLSRLSDRLKLLTGGPREFSERQRTLRSTIEWSYDLLEEGEKALFGRLSVFSGGATLEATEAVCNVSGDLFVSALNGVSSLLDKSLLGQEEGAEGEPRFVMMETIREYAQERLQESGEAESIKRAHAEYFLALAEEAEPMLWGAEDAAWLDRLEREHGNMRAVLSWAIEHGEGELALRVGAALRWFWYMEGYYGEGRRWLEAALSKDWSAVAAEVRARALEGVGWLASSQGDLDRAQAAANEGLQLSTEAGLGDVIVADLQNVLGGAVARKRGDYEWAAELLTESLALHRKAGDIRGVAWSLGDLANVSSDRGNYEQAKDLYEEGLALSRELDGAQLLGAYLISLGYEDLLEGEPERATALIEEAAELYRKRGHRGDLQFALDNLGWAALLRGEYDKAGALHKESVALCRDLGDKYIGSESLEGLACTAGAKGDAERAARLLGAAEALREVVGYQQAPRERALREPYLQAVHSRLEEAAWEKAFMEGRTMGLDEALEYALSKEEETDPLTLPAPEEPSAGQALVALTRREEEVAALVARGLTNRQISEELFISERTIENHVSKILRKLELSSRTEIASWATQQRLIAPNPD
jgi:predicted ATPase/DNA-binding SARP family transcriptional activator/DNA-binding CsgD family transcriptional regulator